MSTQTLERPTTQTSNHDRRKYHHHVRAGGDGQVAFCGFRRKPVWTIRTKSELPCCPECRQVLEALGHTCCNEVDL